jgi:hypothetical protein
VPKKYCATMVLDHMVSDEKPTLSLIIFSPIEKVLFSLAVFKILLSLVFRSLIRMCVGKDLFGFILGGSLLSFLNA